MADLEQLHRPLEGRTDVPRRGAGKHRLAGKIAPARIVGRIRRAHADAHFKRVGPERLQQLVFDLVAEAGEAAGIARDLVEGDVGTIIAVKLADRVAANGRRRARRRQHRDRIFGDLAVEDRRDRDEGAVAGRSHCGRRPLQLGGLGVGGLGAADGNGAECGENCHRCGDAVLQVCSSLLWSIRSIGPKSGSRVSGCSDAPPDRRIVLCALLERVATRCCLHVLPIVRRSVQ